jgi:hypothetical protein
MNPFGLARNAQQLYDRDLPVLTQQMVRIWKGRCEQVEEQRSLHLKIQATHAVLLEMRRCFARVPLGVTSTKIRVAPQGLRPEHRRTISEKSASANPQLTGP